MKINARLFLLSLLALAIALPALAQEAAPAAPAPGFGLAPVIAVLSALAAVLGALMNWIPAGWRTYAGLAAATIAALLPELTHLSQSGQTATAGALLAAIFAALVGRMKAGAPKVEQG